MTTARAAAAYARISSDPTGAGLGVQRQLEDCQRLAESRGWTIAEEYVDNDISAFKGASRPAYERMLADIEAGTRDAVIVYNMDRLTREPRQLEEFVALCDRAAMHTVATVTGDFDLGNDQGLFVARIMSAIAAQESGRKAARLRRSFQQRAERGLPGTSGGNRPFGWERDGVTEVPTEVELLRLLASRFLAGESVHALATWLNEQGHRTTTGNEWRGGTLRNVLATPRLAGLRSHNGQVVAKGVWEPVISEAEHQRIVTLMENRAATQTRSPRVSLLSRMLRCGRCGAVLTTTRKKDVRTYACDTGPGRPGCGRLTINAEPVERIMVEAVLTRLDSPALAAAIRERQDEADGLAQVRETLEADRGRITELSALWADGSISRAEWMTARDRIEARIKAAERRLASSSGHPDVAELVGSGATVRAEWSALNLSRQSAIVRALVDSVTILPAPHRGSRDFLSRIVPAWRV